MKTALVILHADAARGGAERYTLDLAGDLAARGHEVTLLAATFADVPAGVKGVALAHSGPGRRRGYLRFLDALDEHLSGTSYDIVHAMLPVRRCDMYHPHAGVAAEALERGHEKHRGAVRRALARAGNWMNLKRRAFARVERELLTGPRPPVVLCLSDYVKEAVRRHYAVGEDRLFRLFNAVDLRKFDPDGRPGAGAEVRRRLRIDDVRVVALMIAQDFERKGVREAVEALARMGPGRPALVVVGRDDARRYRRIAKGIGVGGDVVFAGATGDPYAFYQAADFFVLPTRHDPCSLVVLEALAMGVPVISTRQNGACEIMEHGQEGYVLTDAGDVEGLAEAMREMMNGTARKRMREAALRLRPELSQEAHMERLMEGYELARGRK